MQAFATKIRRFLASEDGPTAVEYAVMLALIIVACITAVTGLGTALSTKFTTSHRTNLLEPRKMTWLFRFSCRGCRTRLFQRQTAECGCPTLTLC